MEYRTHGGHLLSGSRFAFYMSRNRFPRRYTTATTQAEDDQGAMELAIVKAIRAFEHEHPAQQVTDIEVLRLGGTGVSVCALIDRASKAFR